MKKGLLLLSLFLVGAMALPAADINLGTFPVGEWEDSNYDAIWEFSSDNIRILSTDGELYFDFSEAEIEDFKVAMEGMSPVMSFSCEETGRSYKFTKPATNLNIILEIDYKPYIRDYRVEMKKK